MGLLDWIGRRREARGSTAIGSGYVSGAPNLSGTYITPQTAIGLTAVFAAINRISTDTACLPLHVYEKRPDGGREIAEDFYLEELLSLQPNDELDAFALRRDSMGHVLGWGTGYQEVARSKGGRVTALHLLHPAKTQPKRTDNGRLYYELDQDPRKRKLPEDVLKFSGLGFNGLTGYNPCLVAKQSLGLSMAAEQFGAAFFGNGAVPHGILKTLRKLGTQAVNNLRNSIGQVHQGSQSAHQLMILEEGLEYQQTAVSPELAQFIATRQFGVIEVARMWSIPPHKIGDYSEAHLTNIEQANIDYICTTLCGHVVMLESQYNLKLLSREERKKYVILHDFSQLLRGDMAARIAWLKGMHEMGCMSADDILRYEGRNPIGPKKGGDKYLVQGQYIPLEKAGEIGFSPAVPKKKEVQDE